MRKLKRFLVLLPNFEVVCVASLFSTFSFTSSGALVAEVFVAREPALRDENDADGRLKRFFGFDGSVDGSAGDSVDELLPWNLKRLRPALIPPRPFGASVVVVVGA